jgi:peroxiredoxin
MSGDYTGLPADLCRRLTFFAETGRIVKVFCPVFPPDRDAGEVLAWLRDRAAGSEAAR